MFFIFYPTAALRWKGLFGMGGGVQWGGVECGELDGGGAEDFLW